jgi:serine/threonine protein kinase
LGGQPLSKIMYSTKGKFFQGERIYEVKQDPKVFDILQQNDCFQFKIIIIKIVQALCLLDEVGVVHADLKPDNVLVDIDIERRQVLSVKLIDFGTSFKFE